MKKNISIIIPVYNEEKNIPIVYSMIQDVFLKLPSYDYECIFINDGSSDGSSDVIINLASLNSRVRYIEFSRNFGKEMATTAGIKEATGDAVIMIDADLQHPPVLIPQMISCWEKGAEVVVGMRTTTKGVSFTKKIGSWFFYKIMSLISETTMDHGETDFRLIDRSVVTAFNPLSEHQRMTRSLINWLGFKKEFVTFEAPARIHGEAKYSTKKLIHLAIYSFVTNSLKPLRFAGYLGLMITFLSGLLGLVVFTNKYIFNDPFGWKVSGSAQLSIINVFLIGIVLMMLGIISLYIGNINSEVVGRPLYIVRKRINI